MKTCADIKLFAGGIKPLPESGRLTGMYKEPVRGPIDISYGGFDSDQQADRRVHGGPEKAIHSYPSTHYAKLATHFPNASEMLVVGSIGENISSDLTENDVRIGDIWRLGSALIQVCQPRNPCWKIDERFRSEGMAQFIAEHLLTGWYWRVLEPGRVLIGDNLVLEAADEGAPTLYESMVLWSLHRPDVNALDDLAKTKGIALEWKIKIERRLEWLRKNSTS